MTELKTQTKPLADHLDDFFTETGVTEPTKWRQFLPEFYPAGPNADRIYVNGALRRMLGLLQTTQGILTHEERFCVVDTGAFSDWASLVRKKVIPLLVKHW